MASLYRTLISLAGLVIILFAITNYIKQRNLSRQLIDRETVYSVVKLENQKKDSIINVLGKTVSQQKSLITDSKEVINNISNEVFDLKKKDAGHTQTVAYWKQITTTKFDTIRLEYRDTVVLNTSMGGKGYITVPKVATVDSPYYKIETFISEDDVKVTKLEIPDTLSFRIVEKSNGLFKPNTIEFQNKHANPFVVSNQESSIYYQPKQKNRLTTTLIKVGIGILAGLYLAK